MKFNKQATAAMAAAIALSGTFSVAASAFAATPAIPRGQHLTVWSWWGQPELGVVQKLAAQWGKAHGDTVTVVDQSKNSNSFQFYATAARAGKGPDVGFAMPHDNLGTFQQEGLLAPVSLNAKLYNPTTAEAVKIQGKDYAYPISVQSVALFYNKDKIKTPPKTWAQFVQDANKYGFGFSQHNLYFDYAFIGGMGGYVFKDNHGTLDPNNIGLANKGAVAAFTLLHDMNWKYHWMNPNTTGAISKALFSKGKLGMYISGPWDISSIQQAKINLGIAPIPNLPNGHVATPFLGVMSAFVNARSHNPVAAQALASYLASAGEMGYFHANADLPALTRLQKLKAVQTNPLDVGFIAQSKTAIPMPNIPQMQAVWNAASIIGNIIRGSVSPQQGATQFVKNIQAGIKISQG